MSQDQALFYRDWAVTIGLNNGAQGKLYRDLKITFDIEKCIGSANKAKIEIYNLNGESRKQYLQADPQNLKQAYQIQLIAGYKGLARTLYIGDVRCVTYKRQGADIITCFECGESEKPLFLAKINKSYPPGTTFKAIINDLIAATGIDIGTLVGIKDEVYNSGVTVNGRVKDILEQYLKKQNLQLSIQNNSIYVCPPGQTNRSQAIVLSNQVSNQYGLSGLIGMPSTNQGITQFSALLDPRLLPLQAVQIFSEAINGQFFVIRKAHFEGDSHGSKWNVNCEAFKIDARVI